MNKIFSNPLKIPTSDKVIRKKALDNQYENRFSKNLPLNLISCSFQTIKSNFFRIRCENT